MDAAVSTSTSASAASQQEQRQAEHKQKPQARFSFPLHPFPHLQRPPFLRMFPFLDCCSETFPLPRRRRSGLLFALLAPSSPSSPASFLPPSRFTFFSRSSCSTVPISSPDRISAHEKPPAPRARRRTGGSLGAPYSQWRYRCSGKHGHARTHARTMIRSHEKVKRKKTVFKGKGCSHLRPLTAKILAKNAGTKG